MSKQARPRGKSYERNKTNWYKAYHRLYQRRLTGYDVPQARDRKKWFRRRAKYFQTVFSEPLLECVELYCLKGTTQQHIAEILDIDQTTVDVWLNKAIVKLEAYDRKLLTERGKADFIEALPCSEEQFKALLKLNITTRTEAKAFMKTLMKEEQAREQFLDKFPFVRCLLKNQVLVEYGRCK